MASSRHAVGLYSLSRTCTATSALTRGVRSGIGVGQVKKPTLAIMCATCRKA
jgi:hypothetical protein